MIELWQKRDNPNVIVEAVRLNEDNVEAIAVWTKAEVIEEIYPEHPDEDQKGLNVNTPNGVQRASLGMYVAKFGKNFFVSHTRPFEIRYMPVSRPAPPPESAGDARKALGFSDPFDRGRFM